MHRYASHLIASKRCCVAAYVYVCECECHDTKINIVAIEWIKHYTIYRLSSGFFFSCVFYILIFVCHSLPTAAEIFRKIQYTIDVHRTQYTEHSTYTHRQTLNIQEAKKSNENRQKTKNAKSFLHRWFDFETQPRSNNKKESFYFSTQI